MLVLQGLKVNTSRDKGAQALGSWTPDPPLFAWVLRESVRKNVCPGANQQPSLQGFQEAEPGVSEDLVQMLTTSATLWVSAQRSLTLQLTGAFEWNSSQGSQLISKASQNNSSLSRVPCASEVLQRYELI